MDENSEKLEFIVTDEYEGLRIDKLISELVDSLSRSFIKKLIDDDKVTCNDKKVKASYQVSEGDKIELEIPPLQIPEIVPEDIPLDILYEDNDVLIVNKPNGNKTQMTDITGVLRSMYHVYSLRWNKNE
ncbi:MAG: hypothetical protein J6N21_09855, partial [Butyrivibrio sp.]|nr:hypothetical protein [Butyrivibrio sp.]